jgi:hypothetical protein
MDMDIDIKYKNYENNWVCNYDKKNEKITRNEIIYVIKKNENINNLYVLKILKNEIYDYVIDKTTIQLHYKLFFEGITPKIFDYGYIYANEYYKNDIPNLERYKNKNDIRVCYYIMEKYEICGIEYIKTITKNVTDYDRLNQLYKKYMKNIFTLYKKLSLIGICSFDIKDTNVVINYNKKTFEIEDLRLIDIDCEFTEITLKPPIIKSTIYFNAMILMHFITHQSLYKYSFESPSIKYYYGLIKKNFNFNYLTELKFSINQSYYPNHNMDCNTYLLLFCYYYKKISVDEFITYTKNKQIEIFNKILCDILKLFPFE